MVAILSDWAVLSSLLKKQTTNMPKCERKKLLEKENQLSGPTTKISRNQIAGLLGLKGKSVLAQKNCLHLNSNDDQAQI